MQVLNSELAAKVICCFITLAFFLYLCLCWVAALKA
jgi:hypothetical protein